MDFYSVAALYRRQYIHIYLFQLQVKNHTSVHGMVAIGALLVLMNLQDTTESTRELNLSSVLPVVVAFHVQITWLFTWSDTRTRPSGTCVTDWFLKYTDEQSTAISHVEVQEMNSCIILKGYIVSSKKLFNWKMIIESIQFTEKVNVVLFICISWKQAWNVVENMMSMLKNNNTFLFNVWIKLLECELGIWLANSHG